MNAGPTDQVVNDAVDAIKVTIAKPDAKNAGSNGQNSDTAGTGKVTGVKRDGRNAGSSGQMMILLVPSEFLIRKVLVRKRMLV